MKPPTNGQLIVEVAVGRCRGHSKCTSTYSPINWIKGRGRKCSSTFESARSAGKTRAYVDLIWHYKSFIKFPGCEFKWIHCIPPTCIPRNHVTHSIMLVIHTIVFHAIIQYVASLAGIIRETMADIDFISKIIAVNMAWFMLATICISCSYSMTFHLSFCWYSQYARVSNLSHVGIYVQQRKSSTQWDVMPFIQ